jgi:hypothetical protein
LRISPATLFKIGTVKIGVRSPSLHTYIAFEKNSSSLARGGEPKNRCFTDLFWVLVSHAGLNIAGPKG